MSEIEIIGRFEPFSFQHETRAAPKQVVLSDDVEQRRCEQHVAEDEVDVCGEQGLDTDVVWSKGGVLVQSMKLPGVHHVIWTRFPKPFGRSLCVLHDHGTIMSVYSHNGATYCNPLLRPALSVWALDVSGGLLLETAGQDGSSGNGSVPMQESATSPTHASTGKRSLPGSPMDLLAASLPASPMSQAGDRALVECTPLLYVRHPLMSAQSVAHSSAPPLPHQDLQVVCVCGAARASCRGVVGLQVGPAGFRVRLRERTDAPRGSGPGPMSSGLPPQCPFPTMNCGGDTPTTPAPIALGGQATAWEVSPRCVRTRQHPPDTNTHRTTAWGDTARHAANSDASKKNAANTLSKTSVHMNCYDMNGVKSIQFSIQDPWVPCAKGSRLGCR